ncbi:hypothetical protein [Streptomyces niveiscabiei]|uniref:Uncharacterized protein n=1 Tax=Streptomyces niveiscabiei TaxID=164115 RepID=A0ABW9HI34_9ACTN
MDKVSPKDSALAEFASKVSVISSSFTEQTEQKITLGELLEIIGVAVPGETRIPVKFKVKIKGKRHEGTSRSRVSELNDSVFVEASEALAGLLNWGRESATTTDLASLLELALKASDVEFADVHSEEITQISAAPPKRVAKTKIGDIVAIPTKAGGYRIAVITAKNRFGTALGFFRGVFKAPRIRAQSFDIAGIPIYTDEQLIAAGVWPIVDHDEGLLKFFPGEPEIYHAPDVWPNRDFGAFGAAETSDGKVRSIDEEEAGLVGIGDGSYQQVHMSEHLQRLLDEGFNGVD